MTCGSRRENIPASCIRKGEKDSLSVIPGPCDRPLVWRNTLRAPLGTSGLRLRAARKPGRAATVLIVPARPVGQCAVGCACGGGARGGGGVDAAASAGAFSFFQRTPSVRL